MIRVLCCEEKKDDFDVIAAKVFKLLKLKGRAALELEFVDSEEMTRLNRVFRDKDAPTDVLSFPMLNVIKVFDKKNYPFDTCETGEVVLGGIVICLSVAEKNALESECTIRTELCCLFTHGLLHLLGYDHMTDQDLNQMRKLENLILSKSGIKF